VELFHRCWQGDGVPARATVVLAHGVAEHSGRYEHVGRRLAASGYPVWALDHRGHGRSGGHRVWVDTFAAYEEDLEAFRELVSSATGGAGGPQVLLGHSMGGAIAVGHAIDHPGSFDALVLTGPALQPARGVSRLTVAAGTLAARLWSRAPALALDDGRVSRDPAVVSAYRADPLVHHGKLTAGLAHQLLRRTARFEEELAAVEVPVLLVHGTEDTLVPIEGSRALLARFGSADVTFVEEPGLFHEVLNEPERERVLGTIVAWLDDHFGGPERPAPGSGPTVEGQLRS
jgi:alpha-beta hydrolase superfamily lysophospholipase